MTVPKFIREKSAGDARLRKEGCMSKDARLKNTCCNDRLADRMDLENLAIFFLFFCVSSSEDGKISNHFFDFDCMVRIREN